jgi:hypothetical protein
MLASKLSDSQTPGLSTTNVIYKENVLKGCLVPDFQPGYQYEINIHIGMTSVKITATVTPWKNATDPAVQVDLPDNQDGPVATDPAGNADGYTAVSNYGTYTKDDVLNGPTAYFYKKGNDYVLCNGDNVEDWCSGADDASPVNVQIYTKDAQQQGGSQEPVANPDPDNGYAIWTGNADEFDEYRSIMKKWNGQGWYEVDESEAYDPEAVYEIMLI